VLRKREETRHCIHPLGIAVEKDHDLLGRTRKRNLEAGAQDEVVIERIKRGVTAGAMKMTERIERRKTRRVRKIKREVRNHLRGMKREKCKLDSLKLGCLLVYSQMVTI
jgi:hypothetical protein